MTEILTLDDLKILQRPFPPEAHAFNPRGFCYVAEEEVTARLEEVDPAWTFEVQAVKREGIGNQQCLVIARMTLKSVWRDSTGMQMVEYTNASGGKSERESGEPEKAATTDALRRCARLFGVGRYILKMGDAVKNTQQLDTWLKKNYPQSGSTTGTQAGTQNGNAQPQVHVLTGVKSVKIVHKDDKKWIDAGGVTFWSRQPFADAGYDTESWTKPGVIPLKEVPFTVHFTVNDKNFKNGVKVVAE